VLFIQHCPLNQLKNGVAVLRRSEIADTEPENKLACIKSVRLLLSIPTEPD
jgi:hypothetical protein